MSARFAAVKGMNDILPPDSAVWQRVEQAAREVFRCHGFAEARTPIVEDTALFVRSVGEVTDIVSKEMYTFEDKGGRSITMRPEGTAPLVRAYIESGRAQTEPSTRWYYLGPMFRYERMKTGRYRQFYQLGAEAYGSAEPVVDVELIALAHAFFARLGLPHLRLDLNSLGDGSTRGAYLEVLARHFAPVVPVMSEDARATYQKNTLRLLDSKEEALNEAIATAPPFADHLDEGSRVHFAEVQRLLGVLGIPFRVNPRLVRGLDYYTRTTFEFVFDPPGEDSALGTAGTVCGGGRYDGLVEMLGGPPRPGVGFAMGLDRLVMLLSARGTPARPGPDLFVVTFDGPVRDEGLKLVMRLRELGLRVELDPRGGKPGKQLERASKLDARFALLYGEAEHQAGRVKLKDLRAAPDAPPEVKEREVPVDGVVAAVRAAGDR